MESKIKDKIAVAGTMRNSLAKMFNEGKQLSPAAISKLKFVEFYSSS